MTGSIISLKEEMLPPDFGTECVAVAAQRRIWRVSRGEELDHFTEFFHDRSMLYLFSFSSKRPFPAFAGDSKLVCVLQAHRHVHRSLTVDRYRLHWACCCLFRLSWTNSRSGYASRNS